MDLERIYIGDEAHNIDRNFQVVDAEVQALQGALAGKTSKLLRWLGGRSGVLPAPKMMTDPPTVTISSAPTVNALAAGSCSHAWDGGFLDFGVDNWVQYAAGIGISATRTNSDGSRYNANVSRMRFLTDAPEFELVTAYSQFVDLNIVVDGEVGFANSPAILPTSSGSRYVKFSFGANAQGFEIIQAQTPSAQGAGYVTGDEITLAGGTGTPAVLVVVGTGGGGAATSVKVKNPGNYSVKPAGAVAQASTTGIGTGFQITTLVWGSTHSTRKMRSVEIYFNSAIRVRGLNVDTHSTVQRWDVPAHLPRLVIVGDSQSAGTYLTNAFGHMGTRIAHRLGLADSFAINAAGGTGWNVDNGINLKWSAPQRLADYAALAPDILLFIGSQNDTQNAALQTAVEAALDTLHSTLPTTAFVGIGSVLSSASDRTKAAFDSRASSGRCAWIDNITAPWLTGTGNINSPAGNGNSDYYRSSDVQHLDHSGINFFSDIAAQKVFQAVGELFYPN